MVVTGASVPIGRKGRHMALIDLLIDLSYRAFAAFSFAINSS